MPDDDLPTRVAVLQTRQEHQDELISMLREDLQATKSMVRVMDEKFDRRFEDLRTMVMQAIDGLRTEISKIETAIREAAANVTPRLMWNVTFGFTVAGMLLAGLGVYAAIKVMNP